MLRPFDIAVWNMLVSTQLKL